MGRRSRQRSRRAGRSKTWRTYDVPCNAGDGSTLMNGADLEAGWRNERCGHANAITCVFGLCAALSCPECDIMDFLLRFGRPKRFEVSINDGTRRPVGNTSMYGAEKFIFGRTTKLIMPEGFD